MEHLLFSSADIPSWLAAFAGGILTASIIGIIYFRWFAGSPSTEGQPFYLYKANGASIASVREVVGCG